MNAAALRQELKGYIDAVPDSRLETVLPVLRSYTETANTGEPLVIETDLTGEEHALIAEGMRHYRERPEDFIDIDEL